MNYEKRSIPSTEMRNTLIKSIIAQDLQAFIAWKNTAEDQPRLDLPEDATRFLIPPRVFELANDPQNITIRISRQEKNSLRFCIVEAQRGQQSPDALDEYMVDNILEPKDYYFNTISLDKKVKTALYVNLYDDFSEHQGKGVATSFYERLREFAQETGFRYIMGKNSRTVQGFFIQKLGRKNFMDLPWHVQKKLIGAAVTFDDLEEITVDTLYPEDLQG